MKPIKIDESTRLAVSARIEQHHFVDAGEDNCREVVIVNLWNFLKPQGAEKYPYPLRIAEGVAIMNPIDQFDSRKSLHLALTRALDVAGILEESDRRKFHDHLEEEVTQGKFD